MTNVGIAGVTGYAGQELLRILLAHPRVKITYLASSGKTDPGPVLKAFGTLPTPVRPFDPAECARSCQTVFLSLPHDVSMACVPRLVSTRLKILDLSGAFRLRDPGLYRKYYDFTHTAPALLARRAYGLPELYARKIKHARLIAVPGCYPTGALIPLVPMYRKHMLTGQVVIDAKSGITGAGRDARPDLMFAAANESVKAYGLFNHRHGPEILQVLREAARKPVPLVFTPHLVPMNRGILTTTYATLKKRCTRETILKLLNAFYRSAPFVRIIEDGMPETQHVRGTNYCDVGAAVQGRNLILISAIDNLGKGAAGQAVQAFNLQHKLAEETGLTTPAGAP